MTKHNNKVVLKVGSTGVVVDTDRMDVIHVGNLSSFPQDVIDAAIDVSGSNVSPAIRDLVTSASDFSLLASNDDSITASGKRTYRIPGALKTMFALAVQNTANFNPDFTPPETVTKILSNSSLSLSEVQELHNATGEFWEEYSGEALRAWSEAVIASAFPDTSQYVPVHLPEAPATEEERESEELSGRKTKLQRYATLDPDEEGWQEKAVDRYETLAKTSPTRAKRFREKLHSAISDMSELIGEESEEITEDIMPEVEVQETTEPVLATGQGPTSTDTINPKKVKARLPQEPVLVADPSSLVSESSNHPFPREAKPSVAAALGEEPTNGSGPTPPSTPQPAMEQQGPRNRETAGQPDTEGIEPSGEGVFVEPHSESGAWDTGPSGTLVTPDHSKYQDRIKYLAVVDVADIQSVLDLLAVVPQSDNPGDVKVFVREGRTWVVSDKYLIQLRSTAPPPVVSVSAAGLLKEIIRQVDTWGQKPGNEPKEDSLRAATYPITNPRAEGTTKVAQNLASASTVTSPSKPEPPAPPTPSVDKNTTSESTENTSAAPNNADTPTPAADDKSATLPSASKVTFTIPLVLPEKTASGDGRMFKEGALSSRDLPIPLLWQQQGFDGHSGSVIVGRIDTVDYEKGKGLVNAFGTFDDGAYAQEAIRLIKNQMLRGISADLDNFEASMANKAATKSTKSVGSPKMEISSARLMGVTLVAKPAFQECVITIKEEPVQDGVYVEKLPKSLTASATPPVDPPADWFEQPTLTEPTPLTIADDGKVFGHIALWNTDHIGMPNGTKPPKSTSNYAYFHTGVVKTADGNSLPVGQLTLAGGHAPLDATAAAAVRHYDDTASAIADVRAGEDDHGVWVSGALRPNVNELQLRTLRASSPSGDWRPIKGSLELVAVCQVNVPGFPITRARVASGHVTALVAAGASMLAQMRIDREKSIDNRLHQLEAGLDSVLKAASGFNINTSTAEGLAASAALQRARVNFRR